jgi:hypothetical protein
MVDYTSSTGPVSNALRAPATVATLNNPQQVNQKFIDLMANGAKPTTVQPAGRSAGSSKSGNLPRGSLVDILA